MNHPLASTPHAILLSNCPPETQLLQKQLMQGGEQSQQLPNLQLHFHKGPFQAALIIHYANGTAKQSRAYRATNTTKNAAPAWWPKHHLLTPLQLVSHPWNACTSITKPAGFTGGHPTYYSLLLAPCFTRHSLPRIAALWKRLVQQR